MLASELSLPIWATPDQGYLSDIWAITDWTGRFGLGDWFYWVKLK